MSSISFRATQEKRLLAIARELLACPTAPFHEEAPAAYVRTFVRRLGLECRTDRAGNLIVDYRRGRPQGAVSLVAHLDHPGFELRAFAGNEGRFRVHGNVPTPFLVGAPIRCFLPDGGTVPGRITATHANPATGKVAEISARLRGRAELGCFAMFEMPPVDVNSRWIRGRVLDNLAGCVAMCALLERLVKSKAPAHVYFLFTRAEEVGFAGAGGAAKAGTIPRDVPVISIEMSKRRPDGAVQGEGFVVRVGDRRSIFDGAFTGFLVHLAQETAEVDKGFRFQKRILDGGTCEATCFQAMGYRASGLACPLGNYHNAAIRGIGREYIRTSDFIGMTRFLETVSLRIGEWAAWQQGQREYAMEAYETYARRLAHPLRKPAPRTRSRRSPVAVGAGR